MSTVRAVFDVNILISARLSISGAPFRSLALAKAGTVQSVTCSQLLNEFAEKLVAKFGYSVQEARQCAGEIANVSTQADVPGRLRVIAADPDDDVVLECAVVGKADYVVSGDHHLLDMGRYKNIEIVKPNEFLALVRQRLQN